MDLGCSRYFYKRIITLFIATFISLPSFAAPLTESVNQMSFALVGVMALAAFIAFSFNSAMNNFKSSIFIFSSAALATSLNLFNEPSLFLSFVSLYLSAFTYHLISLTNDKNSENKTQLPVVIIVFGLIAASTLVLVSTYLDIKWLWVAISVGHFVLASLSNRVRNEQFAKSNIIKVMVWFSVVAVLIGAYGQVSFDSEMLFICIALISYLVYLAMVSAFSVETKTISDSDKPRETNLPIAKDEIVLQHDPATNLPSNHQVIRQIELEAKQKQDSKLAVIVFKPINFQQVNTVLGHHNSDILLLQFAYSLQQKLLDKKELLNFNELSQPIRIGRLQGLNFIVVLDLTVSHHPDKNVIKAFCQELMSAVPEAMSFKSFSLNFELAFGVATLPEHGNSVSEVIAHAGDALLEAEQSHQQIVYFTQDSVLFTEQQLRKMEQLKMDIADEKLGWYLQPQIALSDKKIKGFELLVHWYYQSEVPLELHEFIKTAEYSGDVYLLTKQMIKQAFKTLFKLQKLGVYQPISVNLSSKDLLEPDLIDYIESQIQNYNVPAKYLIIELNEEVMVNAGKSTKAIIDQLRSLEVGISIDRFTGSYESLRYLRKMSINQVKIDCSYLEEKEMSHADKAIINALINVCRNMQLPFVGTGIRTKEIEDRYRSIGGEFGQGSAVSKGVVLAELEIWLDAWFQRNPSART